MTRRRHPRDGILARWIAAIPGTDVSPTVKFILLYLVATDRVTPLGYLTFSRETVAAELGIHPQTLSAHIRAAREAGLLDRRGGGFKGWPVSYAITIPTPRLVIA